MFLSPVDPDSHFDGDALVSIQTRFGLSGSSSDADLDRIAADYSRHLKSRPQDPVLVIALRDFLRYLRADIAAAAGDNSWREQMKAERRRCPACKEDRGGVFVWHCQACGAKIDPFSD